MRWRYLSQEVAGCRCSRTAACCGPIFEVDVVCAVVRSPSAAGIDPEIAKVTLDLKAVYPNDYVNVALGKYPGK